MTLEGSYERELRMNKNTVVGWNSDPREVVLEALIRQKNDKIGEDRIIVKVDETLVTRKKNNIGCMRLQRWIFGRLCRKSEECFGQSFSLQS